MHSQFSNRALAYWLHSATASVTDCEIQSLDLYLLGNIFLKSQQLFIEKETLVMRSKNNTNHRSLSIVMTPLAEVIGGMSLSAVIPTRPSPPSSPP